jgi:PQQ-dependent dehydrogenase (s-GDH family)
LQAAWPVNALRFRGELLKTYLGLLCLLLLMAAPSIVGFQQEPFTTRVVTTGLEGPWEITWGPDERLWVTERTGRRVTRVNPADGSKTTAVTISEVFQNHGQDGLLGLALHSDILRGTGNDFVYVAYTYDADSGPELNRRGKIRRYTYDRASQTLQSPMDLISNLPAGTDHLAFRLAFGPDQKLYLSVGDQGANWLQQNYCNLNRAQEMPTAAEVRGQDWIKYQGKILRLNLDGTIPSDNPMLGGVRSHIYTSGHRNPQGLAFGPGGKLFSSEHGPDTDDEFNRIDAGKNYGWPNVAGYKDDKVYVFASWAESSVPCASLRFSQTTPPPSVPLRKEGAWNNADFAPPLKTFFTVEQGYDIQASGSATIAPGGLDIYPASGPIPGWGNSALVLSLKYGKVYRLKLNADGTAAIGEATEHFKSTNRYRDIAIHPDGRTIYLATDSAGSSTDAAGRSTRALANPGSILAFTYN